MTGDDLADRVRGLRPGFTVGSGDGVELDPKPAKFRKSRENPLFAYVWSVSYHTVLVVQLTRFSAFISTSFSGTRTGLSACEDIALVIMLVGRA
jgi:hypothetical protein